MSRELDNVSRKESKKSAEGHKLLGFDTLRRIIGKEFKKIADPRPGNCQISLHDALMSAFAMFSLKDPSLLAFDDRRKKKPQNIRAVFGVQNIPTDSGMRDIDDKVPTEHLRPVYKSVFEQACESGLLDRMRFIDGHYLLNLDGVEFFRSKKLKADFCLTTTTVGETSYHLKMLGAVIVHPDFKEVIPLFPEVIQRQDGATKNDCEQNAAKRFYEKLRQDYPDMPFIVNGDALYADGPHLQELQKYNLRYLLVAKPTDLPFLFKQANRAIKQGKATELFMEDAHDPKVTHAFRFVEQLPLNKTHHQIRVNLLEYWEAREGEEPRVFGWITDLQIRQDNAFMLMRGGRARWKVENETFNTLKNQGYHLEHNYGLGKEHLAPNFALLMMLAFLVDQIQQLASPLFQAAWKEIGCKCRLWEKLRNFFDTFQFSSMEMLLRAILEAARVLLPFPFFNTS
jgi:hypothetical protein